MNTSVETQAKLACVYAGAVWGLFWIPLRGLTTAGVHELWTIVIYFFVPAIVLMPVAAWRWPHLRRGGIDLQVTAAICGLALTLYAIAIVYTDVVRAMLLFYLTPIWSAVLARIVLGEAITRIRLVSMVVAVTGMLTIFGLGVSFPLPRNAGDWMGLASGLVWAVATVRLRNDTVHGSLDMTLAYFMWSLGLAVVAAIILANPEAPDLSQITPVLPWLVPVMLVLIIPGAFMSLWGPKFLNPGVVGLLFMSEIVVGSVSAALWAGEPFGRREITGVILIGGASLLEPLRSIIWKQRKPKVG